MQKSNSVNHALSCMKGGYSVFRHNNARDTEAEILREVCKDVTIEPPLMMAIRGYRGTGNKRGLNLPVSSN